MICGKNINGGKGGDTMIFWIALPFALGIGFTIAIIMGIYYGLK